MRHLRAIFPLLILSMLLGCGGHSASSSPAPAPTTPPENWDFTLNLTLAGKDTPLWSSTNDPWLKEAKLGEFETNGKLDIGLRLPPVLVHEGTFTDYLQRPICVDYAEGYTAIAGWLYARRKLDNGTWETKAAARKAYFFLTQEQPWQKFLFHKPQAPLPAGHYKLEIDTLSWNGPCLHYQTAQSCGSNGLRSLDQNARYPNPDGGENFYYCVSFTLSAAWTEASDNSAAHATEDAKI